MNINPAPRSWPLRTRRKPARPWPGVQVMIGITYRLLSGNHTRWGDSRPAAHRTRPGSHHRPPGANAPLGPADRLFRLLIDPVDPLAEGGLLPPHALRERPLPPVRDGHDPRADHIPPHIGSLP